MLLRYGGCYVDIYLIIMSQIDGSYGSFCPFTSYLLIHALFENRLHETMDGESTLLRIALHQGVTQQDANRLVEAGCISGKRLEACPKLRCSFEKQFFRNGIRG